tara:strand:- start:1244 stop:1819 length:576 start_codon:yes stop_codon:yes gene_type:complete
MTSIAELFGTPLYRSKVNNYDEIQKEFSLIVSDIPFKRNPYYGQNNFLTYGNFDRNIIKERVLINFEKELEFHIKLFSENLNFQYRSYNIRSSWIAKFEKGSDAHIHDHGSSDISGVYYYKKCDSDGNIFFQSPVAQSESSMCFWNPHFQMSTEQGELLLFPGYLKHGIHTNNTEEDRISFSFDIVFNRME